MTENFKPLPKHVPASGRQGAPQHELPVTLKLPLEVANAIAQRMSQSGQTQTQVILEALALSLKEAPSQKEPEEKALVLEELEQLKRRLAELETLIPKVAMLEGKSIAF